MKNYLLAMLVLLWAGVTLQATTLVCNYPTNIQVQRISDHVASMNAEGGTSYDLYVKPHGFPAPTPSTPGRVGYRGISMPMTSVVLAEIFDYDVYIRTSCGDDVNSNWVGPIFVATYVECSFASDVSVVRTSHTSASISLGTDTYDAYFDVMGGTGPADVWTAPNAPGFNDFFSPTTRNDLDPETIYNVWFRKQCNLSQVTDWEGPFLIPLYDEPYTVCPNPSIGDITTVRISDTSATYDGADPAYHYQGSANRAGRPLRPKPMYGMNDISVPFTHTALVPSFDYDVWFRTICGDGTFSEWTGPFYVPLFTEMGLKLSPNPTRGQVVIEGIDAVNVQIFGINGNPQMSAKVVNNELNVSNLSPGQYIIKVTDANGKVTTSKLIKK